MRVPILLLALALPWQAVAGDIVPGTAPDYGPDGCRHWTIIRQQGGQDADAIVADAQNALDDLVVVAGQSSIVPDGSERRLVAGHLDVFCRRYPNETVEAGVAALAMRLQKAGQIQ